MRRAFGSVRSRAALGATGVVALALVAAGIAVLLALRVNLHDQAGLQAELDAREVAGELATGVAPGSLQLDEDTPVAVLDGAGRYVRTSPGLERIDGAGDADGTVAAGPSAAPPASPSPSPSASASADRHGGRGEDDDDDDDAPADPGRGEVAGEAAYGDGWAETDGERADYRFAGLDATAPDGRTYTVWAGAPLDTEQSAVGSVARSMLTGLPLVLAVVAGVTWLVTRRALRPVEGIRAEMAAITASTDLTRRVPEPATHDEVARLARTTNETLAALEASVERQRRFVADASHELRSPVASLRTQLEVGAAHPDLLDLDGAVADTVRLQHLAADLLLLARLDAGEAPAAGPVALDELVREETLRRPEVTAGRVQPVSVPGSRGQLARVLANLLDNAVRHAAREVSVSLARDGGRAVLEVADDGPGVPPADRERIFERFVRLDDARSRDDGGAGLGLAICRDVVERHGGTVTVGRSAAGGASFTVRLPAV
ncbi:HAMP domain-containing sensor histidine kinase [Streptomyces sp. NPDC051940]|uniref:sensor histidine kinase n=1 Tax=Streptomyces sp. NPDC051940 TaxID=3155675 RepID=UPI003431A4C8